jgi:hypothetical protein
MTVRVAERADYRFSASTTRPSNLRHYPRHVPFTGPDYPEFKCRQLH